MEQTTHDIVRKISELKKEVPSDWADRIGKKMKKSPTLVRYYARGQRGIHKGYPLEVLKLLTQMRNEHVSEIKKLTA
jgi:hypothetical protein